MTFHFNKLRKKKETNFLKKSYEEVIFNVGTD